MSKKLIFILISVILLSCSHSEKKTLDTELPQNNEALCLLLDNIKDSPESILFPDSNLYFAIAYQSYITYGFNNSTLEFTKRILADSEHLFYREAFDLYFHYAMTKENPNLIEPYIKKKGAICNNAW